MNAAQLLYLHREGKLTPLHQAVAALAGTRPALVISEEAISGFLLNSFLRNVNSLQNISVPVDGFPAIEIRFTGLSVDRNEFRVRLTDERGAIVGAITPDFFAHFSIHVAAQPQLELSTLSIDVQNLRARISVSAPELVLDLPDYDVVGSITEAASRQNALDAAGITEDEVARLEGALAFVTPRRIVNSALSTVSSVNLANHFTALELRGDWSVTLVPSGLVIIPAGGISIKEELGCPTHDSVPDLSIEVGQQTEIGRDQYSWALTTDRVPEAIVHRADDRAYGFASLYAPIPIWEAKFKKAMPAIDYYQSDNGFIGWNLNFTASLEYAGLRIDTARFGLVVDFTILLHGGASLTVDVPCVGRSSLARADFSAPHSDLSILIGFVLSKEGKLLLQASIDRLNISRCEVTIDLFTRWLLIAGGGNFVRGFIMNYIFQTVLENSIRNKIRDAIKNEVNSKNFKILDLETLAQYTRYNTFNTATFSGDNNSVLLGLASLG